MARRPRIGITMRLEMPTRRFYLGRDYSEAIAACGGVPLHISLIPDKDYVRAAVAELDGILLPGSNTDIDPAFYDEAPHIGLGTVIPEKDETDRLVIEAVEERGIPLLGICYGMQALNVWRGGSLIQDIPSQVRDPIKHDQGQPYDRPSHSISIEKDSRLAAIVGPLGPDEVRVNSSHHQAIKEVGRGLRATAWAPDGVIEAIEDSSEGTFIMGVQWHPEVTTRVDRLSTALFEAFVAKCAADRVLN